MRRGVAWLPVVLLALSFANSAMAGEFGVAKFEAGTCKTDAPPVEECSYEAPESQFFTQAAGHPPLGITGLEVNTKSTLLGKEPEGHVKDIRVDIPPGLSVNPQATCSHAELETETCVGKGQCSKEQFEASVCPLTSLVGSDELEAFVGGAVQVGPLSLPMYNLVPPQGVPAEFGVELNVAKVIDVKILIVGGVSWYKDAVTSENSGVPTGDYHEFFTIKEVPTTVGLIKTRLKFTGTAGNGTFITLPSVCSTQTSYLHVDSYESPGQFLPYSTVSGYPPKAISIGGCGQVPFSPSLSLSPGKSEAGADRPDGPSADLHVPQSESATTLNDSDVQNASVTLPEGLTLNPSAAHTLKACTPAQIKIGSNEAVQCPAESEIGTVQIETSMLPPGALPGKIYLAAPTGVPITGPPYTVYVAAYSARYGVGVRLQGSVSPNPQTGQLTVTFQNTPPLPFKDFIVHMNGGEHAPLANPLVCVPAPLSSLTPYTAPYTGSPPASVPLSSPFTAGTGSVCSTTAPFALTQTPEESSKTAGAHTSYTLNLKREDGQQYLSKVSTTLPAGLLGPIPAVTICQDPEPHPGVNGCTAASQIGTANVTAGSGDAYPFSGPVYLTGPYNNAPYGLSIPVAADAGPFALGTLITRAQINVDPLTARLIVSSDLQSVFAGVPLRLRTISVAVNRSDFLTNPTNCGTLATQTTLTSTFGASDMLSSPFQVQDCGALKFTPKFSVSTSAKATRLSGASLTVKLTQPSGQANLQEVHVELPKQLVARLSTLNKACTVATFNANPASCPKASKVGQASATTPVLPGTLSGTAYLVSHGGAAFPDLEIVLSGDGVSVTLDGQTKIKNGITSSAFSTIPDVPVSSFTLNLPTGPYSALSAVGSLCRAPLFMPTTIASQSAKKITQKTKIAVSSCPVLILSARVSGHRAILRVKVPAAGRLSVGGGDLQHLTRRVRKAGVLTLKVGLSRRGLALLGRKGKLKLRVLVGFTPSHGSRSKAHATLRFH